MGENHTFVSSLQNFFGIEHVVPVGRASIGICVALRAWSGGRSIAVALTATVCQDVIAALRLAGCTPIFCDIDPSTGKVKTSEWKRAIEEGASAAIIVHLYGNPEETSDVRDLFNSDKYLLIDDAAQAFGSFTTEGLAGTGGDVGVLSFGNTKHIEVGGGALLIKNRELAKDCRNLIQKLNFSMKDEQQANRKIFRDKFEKARLELYQNGTISSFNKLLEGYDAVLSVPWENKWGPAVSKAINEWTKRAIVRKKKAKIWEKMINDLDLVPVGMDITDEGGCVPWRFTCRLPGCDWKKQQKIGDCLRKGGLDVSHWYLPGSWLLSSNSMKQFPGAEQLAREVFQFWVDENTSISKIEASNSILRKCFE